MTKFPNRKPKYETPIVIALGDLVSASGIDCSPGTSPTTGNCSVGTGGHATCGVGGDPMASSCGVGIVAAQCVEGNSGG